MRALFFLFMGITLVHCQPQPPKAPHSQLEQSPAESELKNTTPSADISQNAEESSNTVFNISYKNHVQPSGHFATFLADETSALETIDPKTLIPTNVTVIEEGGITSPPITWVEAYTHNHSGHFEYEICSQVLSEAEKVGLKDNGCARGRVRWDHILLDNYYSDYYFGSDDESSNAGLQVDAIEGRASLRLRQCIPSELSESEETCGPWVLKDFYHRHNTTGYLNLEVRERQKALKQMIVHVNRISELIATYETSRANERDAEHCKLTELPREVILLLERISTIKKALDTLEPLGFAEGIASAKRTISDLEVERAELEKKYEEPNEKRTKTQTRLQLAGGILASGGGGGFNPDTLDEIGDSIMPIIQDVVYFGKLTKPRLQIDCNKDSLYAAEITREFSSITYLQESIAEYTRSINEKLEARKKNSTQ
ncbi:MAG: hypothetical protein AB8C84_07465 [Oligoflexales bacterium]